MPEFKVEHHSPLGIEDTFIRAKEFVSQSEELHKLLPNKGVTVNDADKTIEAAGGGVKAELFITAASEGGSNVIIEVQLPLHLAFTKKIVKDILNKNLKKALSV